MSFDLGWYYIGEVWNLYLSGDLQKVRVEYINVDEKAESDGYLVNHYGRDGEHLTAHTLDAGDLKPELQDRETTDRPWHI